MWARVSTYQFPSDAVDDAITRFSVASTRFSEALGNLQEPELQRVELFVDRTSGKAMTISVWESENARTESAQVADRLRSEAADAAGVSILSVDHYEIIRQN